MNAKYFVETIKGLDLEDFAQMLYSDSLDELYSLMDEYAAWRAAND